MMAAARYLLAVYLHSRRWAAPFVLLTIGLVVLYIEPPNPVLETAGGAAGFLFLAQCWLALAFLNSQADDDRQVLAATVGGPRFVLARVVGLGLLTLISSLLTLGYPLLALRFDRSPRPAELLLILLANLVCAGAGSTLAALFARPAVRSRAICVLGVATCVIGTVPLGLSPAEATAAALGTTNASRVPEQLAGTAAPVAAFGLIAICISGWLWRYRE